MANASAVTMTVGGLPGGYITIWYNDANLRIGAVEWNIPIPGYACRVRIWDSNISLTTPVIDRTEGQGNGSENVPGNYRMEEVIDPDIGTYLFPPTNLTWAFNIRTI